MIEKAVECMKGEDMPESTLMLRTKPANKLGLFTKSASPKRIKDIPINARPNMKVGFRPFVSIERATMGGNKMMETE
eukprot:CAMPEP_0170554190 /NCGR_PEP_ID=MMETSP0211-20121228/12066_1 /TAXON_ID=311385 /ORGANISM="Pseudokeronopsis sp., Strain OXSARD2" /LENGTH=76 /DNA_ID=CAMNT_0010863089 /DNA_START=974 /DNA_END=1204 /DNA_ORIENTATION=-